MNLEREGYQVIEAENGLVAQGRLRDSEIDLVITDAMMPKMDGLELYQWAREQPELVALPFALMGPTPCLADENRAYREELRQAGWSGLMGKPFHPHEVIRWLKAILS